MAFSSAVQSKQIVVASVSSSTPTAVWLKPTIVFPQDAPVGTPRSILTGITAANTQAPGNFSQVWCGVELSGASSWVATLFTAYLDGGESAAWHGAFVLNAGDTVESYAGITNYIDVTLDIEDDAG